MMQTEQQFTSYILPNSPAGLRLAMSALARLIAHDTEAAERDGLDFPAELDTAIEAFEAVMKALPLSGMEREVYCGLDMGSLFRMLGRASA
jgi:hypothetical protein